jgi:3,4-dihydroxy 2-butanone 4-phosphate synthase/GTP cyclohydrolase II
MAGFESWLGEAAARRPDKGRPLVSLCYAQSLDGSLTVRRGQPTPLSGAESTRFTHLLRRANDAILVGIGTLLADDPLLTARAPGPGSPQPVILDTHLRSPIDARLFSQNPNSPWIACVQPVDPQRQSSLEEVGARIIPFPGDPSGRVDLPSLLDCLGELKIDRLMVEGGARVITSFLAQDLVDLVVLTIAPVFLGGLRSLEARLGRIDGAGLVRPRLRQVEYERLGDDLIVWGSLR